MEDAFGDDPAASFHCYCVTDELGECWGGSLSEPHVKT